MRGSVVRRSKNSWAVKVYMGVDPKSGKERQKWIGGFTSQKEAKAHLLVIAASPAYGSGLGPYGSLRIRLGDYLDDWQTTCKVGEKEQRSREARMRLHVKPHMGHIPLAKIAPPTLERLFAVHLADMNPTSAHKVYRDIRQALERAVRLGLTSSNPAEMIDPPKPREYRPTIWTPEEFSRFVAECGRGGDKGLLFLAAFISGTRQGELLGAQWRYADLEHGVLYVVQDLDRPKGGGFRLDNVKSAHSKRPVRLPAGLVAELRALRKRQVEERLKRGLCPDGLTCRKRHCRFWHDGGFVFCQENGKPLHGHNLTQRDLRGLMKRAGVPRVRFHDLRHMHTTALMREGVNPKVVQERAGHHSAAFTLDRYSWTTPDMQETAVEALERTLADATGVLPTTTRGVD